MRQSSAGEAAAGAATVAITGSVNLVIWSSSHLVNDIDRNDQMTK
jgi:hypothetical protein